MSSFVSIMRKNIFLLFFCCNGQEFSVYNAIKSKLLVHYKRPFTMLIVGDFCEAALFEVVKEFDVTCVVANESASGLIKKSGLDNLIVLNRNINPTDLSSLSECEHFDVVIVLDIKTLIEGCSQKAIKALFDLGDYLFLQLPISDKSFYDRMIREFSERKFMSAEKLLFKYRKKEKEFFLFATKKCCLLRRSWHGPIRPGKYRIESSFTSKHFFKKNPDGIVVSPWIRGINLKTFVALNGIYPTKKNIRELLFKFKGVVHSDIAITNIIIQGRNLELIDLIDPRNHTNPEKKLDEVLSYFH